MLAQLCDLDLTSIMTLTLDFQGQILKYYISRMGGLIDARLKRM